MISITLSRRNLLALLHKLEMVDSFRTIIKTGTISDTNGETDVKIRVTVASDEEVYADRPAGEMHPDTEAFIEDIEEALEIVRNKWKKA